MQLSTALRLVVADTRANTHPGMRERDALHNARDELSIDEVQEFVTDPELREAYRIVLGCPWSAIEHFLPADQRNPLDLVEPGTTTTLDHHQTTDATTEDAATDDAAATDAAAQGATVDTSGTDVAESMRRTDQALRTCDAALHQLDQHATAKERAERERAARLARWHAEEQDATDQHTDDTSAERDLP